MAEREMTDETAGRSYDDISPESESVAGVASVQSVGQITESIDVTLKEDKIDAMNKKVLDALEKKFAEAEKKINKGQDKIDKGKSTLDTKKEEAAGQMAQGGAKLNQASAQIAEGLRGIDTQIANVKEQQKQLLTSEKEAKKGAVVLATQKKNLTATIENLKKAKTALSEGKKALAKLDAQIAAIEEAEARAAREPCSASPSPSASARVSGAWAASSAASPCS